MVLTAGASRCSAEAGQPRIEVESAQHDAGVVYDEVRQVEHSFVLKNVGSADLHIRGIRADCACSVLGERPTVIAPGASATLRIADKLDTFGPQETKVGILTDDPDTPVIVLCLKADRRWEFKVDPWGADMGRLAVGTGREVEVRITPADSTRDLAPDEATVDLPYVTVASVVEPQTPERPRSYLVKIALLPDGPAGVVRGEVRIPTKDANRKQVIVPVIGEVVGPIRVRPSRLDVGVLSPTGTARRTLLLTAKHPFAVRRVEAAGPGITADTQVVDDRRVRLVVDVHAEPLPAGAFSGAVRVRTDQPEMTSFVVPVSGVVHGGAAPAPAAEAAETSPSPGGPLRVFLFQSATCPDCRRTQEALKKAKAKFGDRIGVLWENFDDDPDAFRRLFLFEEHYGVKADEQPPTLFVGDIYINGTDAIEKTLHDVIAAELQAGHATFVLPAEGAESGETAEKADAGLLERFEQFSVGAVLIGGLLDGVNPCAFTTIVFLLSVLAHLGKTRREMAVVGIGFTVAVFVTYLLLGFGMMTAVKSFSVRSGLSRVLAGAVGLLAVGLAVWSLIDLVRYIRTKDVKAATLGLPHAVRARINRVIRQGLSTRRLLIGSLSVGFLVSLLESLCTGQIYLPTIVFVVRSPDLRADAIGCLVLYNLAFIAPLVVLLTVAYWGASSEKLGRFLRRHLGLVKLGMACLFAALGILILTTL